MEMDSLFWVLMKVMPVYTYVIYRPQLVYNNNKYLYKITSERPLLRLQIPEEFPNSYTLSTSQTDLL